MEAGTYRRYLRLVVIGFTRILLGLAIAFFHAPLADFIRKQGRELAAAFRERGLPIPIGLPKRASHNAFFFSVLRSRCSAWLASGS